MALTVTDVPATLESVITERAQLEQSQQDSQRRLAELQRQEFIIRDRARRDALRAAMTADQLKADQDLNDAFARTFASDEAKAVLAQIRTEAPRAGTLIDERISRATP